MNTRTVKWAIGIIAVVVLIGLGAMVLLFVGAFISLEKGEQHRRQFQAELDSGRWDFGDQPALFAIAQGIVKNDLEAIRTAAKGVPDLQAPGRDGATLLDFAVRNRGSGPDQSKQLEPCFRSERTRTTRMVTGTLSRWRTPGIRRHPSSAQCWRQAEMQILAMSLASQ